MSLTNANIFKPTSIKVLFPMSSLSLFATFISANLYDILAKPYLS